MALTPYDAAIEGLSQGDDYDPETIRTLFTEMVHNALSGTLEQRDAELMAAALRSSDEVAQEHATRAFAMAVSMNEENVQQSCTAVYNTLSDNTQALIDLEVGSLRRALSTSETAARDHIAGMVGQLRSDTWTSLTQLSEAQRAFVDRAVASMKAEWQAHCVVQYSRMTAEMNHSAAAAEARLTKRIADTASAVDAAGDARVTTLMQRAHADLESTRLAFERRLSAVQRAGESSAELARNFTTLVRDEVSQLRDDHQRAVTSAAALHEKVEQLARRQQLNDLKQTGSVDVDNAHRQSVATRLADLESTVTEAHSSVKLHESRLNDVHSAVETVRQRIEQKSHEADRALSHAVEQLKADDEARLQRLEEHFFKSSVEARSDAQRHRDVLARSLDDMRKAFDKLSADSSKLQEQVSSLAALVNDTRARGQTLATEVATSNTSELIRRVRDLEAAMLADRAATPSADNTRTQMGRETEQRSSVTTRGMARQRAAESQSQTTTAGPRDQHVASQAAASDDDTDDSWSTVPSAMGPQPATRRSRPSAPSSFHSVWERFHQTEDDNAWPFHDTHRMEAWRLTLHAQTRLSRNKNRQDELDRKLDALFDFGAKGGRLKTTEVREWCDEFAQKAWAFRASFTEASGDAQYSFLMQRFETLMAQSGGERLPVNADFLLAKQKAPKPKERAPAPKSARRDGQAAGASRSNDTQQRSRTPLAKNGSATA